MVSSRDARTGDDADSWSALLGAYRSYVTAVSPHYDEVVHEVARRIELTGDIRQLSTGAGWQT